MKFYQKDLFDSGEFEHPLNYKLNLGAFTDGILPEELTVVEVSGKIVNRAGVVTLNVILECAMNTQCDRCLAPTTPTFDISIFHTIVPKLDGEDTLSDEYIEIDGDVFDIDELLSSELILGMPTVFTCGDDCKGLCPQCGINLNDNSCNCMNKRIDPRLEKLKGLLDG